MSFASRIAPAGVAAAPPGGGGSGIILGDDLIAPPPAAGAGARTPRRRLIALNRSPLARKIVTFNLLAMIVLVAGVLYLNPFRDSLVLQRERALVVEAGLIADIVALQLSGEADAAEGPDLAALAGGLSLEPGVELFLYAPDGTLQATARGAPRPPGGAPGLDRGARSTLITDFLNRVWEGLSALLSPAANKAPEVAPGELARAMLADALAGNTRVNTGRDESGRTVFTVATPVTVAGTPAAVVALTSAAGEIDTLVRNEREQVLQMFVIALLVSIGLSLVLASTIANPISDLAAAAEAGRERNARKMSPARIRIPDLAARPDEIGRLSEAMRGMVAALYDRIDANEQFAADVAHEIKNPLASLRSAVGTLKRTTREDQRQRLLEVIEHDVRRLDRLVSDISNASRLDSELVKEHEEPFDLLRMLGNLGEHLGKQAAEKGVDFITDFPPGPLLIQGLEGRLAQVFVNLLTNAISFCEDGDAVRLWVRRRENRVLVVVEDTGPGIPEQALTKIFKRFYSERPPGQFGEHSGLGLAISKQIVEAHGGVIWAENIRPTDADPTSDPLGARFVVGLPV
ncbi:MAG: HAMP domain-containing histidine kinase [Rhodobacteraceae bacterium]|jgi:two-component system sensor histidine kinase ChvG|nr:HAMP domain-containing histidine kinase [Paracoccaceae bacterium]